MIPVKQIVFRQVEGLHADCREHMCASWTAVELLVRRLARTAPIDSCFKCDVGIEWADGTRRLFRFEMRREHVSDSTPVADAIARELLFTSGRRTPSHMSAQDHADMLLMFEGTSPGVRRRAEILLDSYSVPSEREAA